MTTFGPRREDSTTPGHVILAAYAILSGEPDQPRDWERFRALFTPDALLRPVRRLSGSGAEIEAFGVDEYIASRSAILAARSFYERETSHTEFQFGHLSHILSRYESRRARDQEPFAAGLNSVQLFNDGSQWRIISVAWNAETGEAGHEPGPSRAATTIAGLRL